MKEFIKFNDCLFDVFEFDSFFYCKIYLKYNFNSWSIICDV